MCAELKPPATYEQQLHRLKERGCIIEDEAACADVLRKISYYRLSAYFLPFKDPAHDGKYFDGTTFARVYQIYEFDRKMRALLFSAIEEVEIYLRSQLSYHHAHAYGPSGYMDPENFSQRHDPGRFEEAVNREIKSNSAAPFVKHHLEKYQGKFPLWAAMELFTFGMLSRFYADMKTPDQKRIAKACFHADPRSLESWLRCCTDLRNICAHYGRLYYRLFPAIPRNIPVEKWQERRLYGAILALGRTYPDPQKWNAAVLPNLGALCDEYSEYIDLKHIGFPEDWEAALKK